MTDAPAAGTGIDRAQVAAATALVGLVYLPLVPKLGGQITALIGVILLLRIVALLRRFSLNKWLLALLTIVGVINVLDVYHSLAGRGAGTALLMTMMALKLLELRSTRDLRLITVLYGFLLVVPFFFDTSAWLVAYLALLTVGNFALMADVGMQPVSMRWRRRGRLALVLTGQALPLAIVMFLFFPRIDSPLWDLGLDDETGVTGISDSLEPGAVSELITSEEDAFHVKFEEPPPMPGDAMYWRGLVLWDTDGRRWTQGPQVPVDAEESDIVIIGETVSYTVILEPTNQRWLFGLDMPVSAPSDTRLTEDFQLRSRRAVSDLRLYRMTSAPTYRTTGLSKRDRQRGLQVPDNVTERIRTLVDEWRVDDAAPRQVVERALAYFNDQPFHYTLLPPALGSNPTDEFLFETRSGFCEHYASAFALLMRVAGIPSRIVVGYLGADYNRISGFYLVRQSEAHAWTEVWLDGEGWVRVDPTAAVHPTRVDRDEQIARLGDTAPVRFRVSDNGTFVALARQLRMIADAVDAGWKNWVVGFSAMRQQWLLGAIGLGHLRVYGLVALMITLSALLLAGWSALINSEPRPADPAQRAWQRVCRRLARIGLPRRDTEGPVDYVQRVETRRPDLSNDLQRLLNLYLRLRYRADPAAADTASFQRASKAFRPQRA
jgi:transglutaminase-like putative cysteine protease